MRGGIAAPAAKSDGPAPDEKKAAPESGQRCSYDDGPLLRCTPLIELATRDAPLAAAVPLDCY
jgi:hypothetical protein